MNKDQSPAARISREKLPEESIREHLRQHRASGLSLRQYCKLHQISYDVMVWQRRKRHGPSRGGNQAPSLFVPVEIKPAAVSSESIPKHAQRSAIDIRLRSKRTLRVRGDFDVAVLRRLIAVLEETPC